MKIDVALTSFFVACNVDFKECEAPSFQNFLKAIRPAYKGPTSTDMQNDLLDMAYKHTVASKTTMNNFIPILFVIINDSNLISMIRSGDNNYKFIDIETFVEIDLRSTELTVEKFIQKSVEKVFAKCILKMYAVIYNMECVLPHRNSVFLIREDIEYFIFQCQSQNIKLLENRLIDVELQEAVNELSREFKTVEDDIINLGGTRIVFCDSNSWEDFLKTITSCSSNLDLMRKIVGGNKYKFKQTTLNLLFSENLDEKLTKLTAFSSKVTALKNDILNMDCTLAKCVESWLKFQTFDMNSAHKEIVQNLIEDILKPIPLIANYLHHKYKGNLFMKTDRYKNKIMSYFIDILSAEGMSDLTKYMNENDVFNKLFKKDIKDPMVFWTFAKVEHPHLSKLALELLQIPACVPCLNSKTMLNRVVSEEKMEKLSSLYYTLNINQSCKKP